MTSFFYPIYSRDFSFENIFASESVSPPGFYSERGFGIDYWRTIPKYQSENAIMLYDSPPLFEVEEFGNDAVKFILQIFDFGLDQKSLHPLGNGVFAYVKTIYLDKRNFKILFFSERDRKLTLLRSGASLPTKDLNKYSENFQLIAEADCKSYDLETIQGINYKLSETELEFDRKFNSFKGLIYGFTLGLLIRIVPQELNLKKGLREITNRFAEIKNRIEGAANLAPSNRKKEFDKIAILAKELKQLLTQLENIFKSLFPDQTVSKDQLAEFIFRNYSHLASIEAAHQYITFKQLDDEIFGRSDFETLLFHYYKKSQTPLATSFIQLKKQVENYLSNTEHSNGKIGSLREKSNSAFKDILHSLDSFLDQQILARCAMQNLDLSVIQYNSETHEVAIAESFSNLDSPHLSELQALINILLKNPKSEKGATNRELLLDIVQQAGISLSHTDKSTLLYKYINNEITSYSLESISSPVAKNFVSFIFNPDSIEKLMAFNQVKNVEHQWISYTLWCTFNGFANISKNFLRPIFAVDNSGLQNSIDDYLSKLLANHSSVLPLQQSWEFKANTKIEPPEDARLEKFYNEYLQSLHKITFEQFRRLTAIEDRSRFIDAIKKHHGISKKEGLQIYNALSDFLKSQRLFL